MSQSNVLYAEAFHPRPPPKEDLWGYGNAAACQENIKRKVYSHNSILNTHMANICVFFFHFRFNFKDLSTFSTAVVPSLFSLWPL